MYARFFKSKTKESFFLFGPRGTGKTSWLKTNFPDSPYFDLTDTELYNDLRAQPNRIWAKISKNYTGSIIIDEIQKVPRLLEEIHHQFNKNRGKYQFILTGSSARKLRSTGVNLLAGRLRVRNFYPLLAQELQDDFNLTKALKYGMLPEAWVSSDPKNYLESYLQVYVDQEVRLEGLVRNIEDFARFLEGASLSQASILNISNVASDSQTSRKTTEAYFEILDDLLIAYRLPVFQKKAKRELIKHKKFYFFDVGLYQTIRPRGVLDSETEIMGFALETLILQHLIALNDLLALEYDICFWRTKNHIEVDFVLYGPNGFYAIEVKSGSKFRESDMKGLLEFKKDYPQAKCLMVYGGHKDQTLHDIKIIPADEFIVNLDKYINK